MCDMSSSGKTSVSSIVCRRAFMFGMVQTSGAFRATPAFCERYFEPSMPSQGVFVVQGEGALEPGRPS